MAEYKKAVEILTIFETETLCAKIPLFTARAASHL
jgi:hypothetical protein